MSLVLRPFFAKAEMRPLRSEFGDGRSLLASLKLAVVESLLPNRTAHVGPPSCKKKINQTFSTSESKRDISFIA